MERNCQNTSVVSNAKKLLIKLLRVCLQNDKTITEQVGILHYEKEFYANLFQSKDKEIPDINFTETFKNCPITKASSLKRPLKTSVLSAALKNEK